MTGWLVKVGKCVVLAGLLVNSAASAGIVMTDGDTFSLDGEKIRIFQIDTPETFRSRCENELKLGLQAKARLKELLHSGPLTIVREGEDYFHRTLAYVLAGEVDVGDVLLAEGLALPYRKGKAARLKRLAAWCPAK